MPIPSQIVPVEEDNDFIMVCSCEETEVDSDMDRVIEIDTDIDDDFDHDSDKENWEPLKVAANDNGIIKTGRREFSYKERVQVQTLRDVGWTLRRIADHMKI